MNYPFKHPEVYAELARQGKQKKALARAIGISVVTMGFKQKKETSGDFSATEMKKVSEFLNKPVSFLFDFQSSA